MRFSAHWAKNGISCTNDSIGKVPEIHSLHVLHVSLVYPLSDPPSVMSNVGYVTLLKSRTCQLIRHISWYIGHTLGLSTVLGLHNQGNANWYLEGLSAVLGLHKLSTHQL